MNISFAALASFLLISSLRITSVSAMPPQEADAWRSDLRFMAKEMERTHKNLYHAISREEFAAMITTLDAKIPALARHEAIVEMARIVAAIGDGHTNIYPTRDPKIGFHMLPVAFTFFADGLYIRAAHESRRPLVGAKVLRIGDYGVTQAYAAVKTIIGHENEQGARYWAQYRLAMPEVLHALRITRTLDDVPLTLATDRGEEHITLHSFAPVEIMTGDTATLFNRREGWVDARDLSGHPDPLWLGHTGDTFHFDHVGNLLYVQINKVGDKANETLAHFSQRLHDEISATRPEKVAIDLRLNRGGDGTLIVPVIRSIVQSESIDRKGRFFAIIGPATFSAAQMLVDALEKYTNVTFVGEPTGSRGNAYGDSRTITLPNSGITVRASIYYWQDWHPLDKREATQPQIPAPLTLNAYLNNLDPALQAIAQVANASP
jgi:hypothetical protein